MKNRGETHCKLKEYLATRRQFVDEVKRLKCQVKHLTEAKLKSAMQRVFKHLKQEIEKITAMTLLVDCPELGEISAVECAVGIVFSGDVGYADEKEECVDGVLRKTLGERQVEDVGVDCAGA